MATQWGSQIMAKGYLIATITITDETAYQRYVKAATKAIEEVGCRVLVRGGRMAVKEGNESWNRVVVLEVASYEQALNYYDSSAYQEAKALRSGAAIADFVIAEGG